MARNLVSRFRRYRRFKKYILKIFINRKQFPARVILPGYMTEPVQRQGQRWCMRRQLVWVTLEWIGNFDAWTLQPCLLFSADPENFTEKNYRIFLCLYKFSANVIMPRYISARVPRQGQKLCNEETLVLEKLERIQKINCSLNSSTVRTLVSRSIRFKED